MNNIKDSAQTYWNDRSLKFANYYENPSFFDRLFRKGIYRRFDRSLEICKSLDNPSVLDIGSGPGVNAVNLIKFASISHVDGIDFAPNMNKYAAEYARINKCFDKCDFVEGDFLSYDWGTKRFDVLLALGVFDYVKESKAFLCKMASLTNKAFVISWPGGGLRMALRKMRYTCPLYEYTEKDIRRLHECSEKIKKLELYKGGGGCISVAYM